MIAIVDLPDVVTVAAVSLAISATGPACTKTSAQLTVEETNWVLQKSIAYRGSGR